MMKTSERVKWNRLAVVGAGTMFWTAILQAFIPSYNLGHAMVLAVWIGMGSPYFARSFVDFQRPIRPAIFVGLMLMSPAWPITYWQTKRSS
jgi:hypothetical protein